MVTPRGRRVLGPLGMVDTGFEVPREKWDRVAGMYRRFEVEAVRPPGGGAAVQDVAMAPAVAEATKPTDSDADPTPRTHATRRHPLARVARRGGQRTPLFCSGGVARRLRRFRYG